MTLSTISSAAQLATVLCDAMGAVSSSLRCIEDENHLLKQASLVNQLALLGCTIAEIGMTLSHCKASKLLSLKRIELMSRIVQMSIQRSIEAERFEQSWQGFIKFLEGGMIAPLSDVTRVALQTAVYNETHYLEMCPEDLKNAKRPIYSYHRDCATIVGWRAVDLDECRINLQHAIQGTHVTTAIRAAAQFGTLEICARRIVPIYQRLAQFFAPAEPRDRENQNNWNIPNFTQLDRIPSVLHEDAVLKTTICPITQEPIRDPVGDPTANGHTIYERRAILAWLAQRPVSPVTNRPLTPADLTELPALKAIIDHRLAYHETGLRRYLNQAMNAPSPLAGPQNAPRNLPREEE